MRGDADDQGRILASSEPTGLIYFIGPKKQLTPVKIGWTAAPIEVRLPSIQTGCWVELVCHGAVPGTRAEERAIHRRLAECRIRGEWFEYAPAMDEMVDLMLRYDDAQQAREAA